MGIDIDSMLLVGLPYEELVEGIEFEEEEEDFCNWYEERGLDRASPSYDAPDDECIYGVGVEAFEDSVEDVVTNLHSAFQEFYELTGKPGKVYQTPNVW